VNSKRQRIFLLISAEGPIDRMTILPTMAGPNLYLDNSNHSSKGKVLKKKIDTCFSILKIYDKMERRLF
jgi:hypothetical protein